MSCMGGEKRSQQNGSGRSGRPPMGSWMRSGRDRGGELREGVDAKKPHKTKKEKGKKMTSRTTITTAAATVVTTAAVIAATTATLTATTTTIIII